MGALDDLDHVPVETRAQWRTWLRRNHRTSPGIWLVTWRPASGKPVLDYESICEEAICFGWVDSRPADGSWTALDAVEDLVVPDDLAGAFDARLSKQGVRRRGGRGSRGAGPRRRASGRGSRAPAAPRAG